MKISASVLRFVLLPYLGMGALGAAIDVDQDTSTEKGIVRGGDLRRRAAVTADATGNPVPVIVKLKDGCSHNGKGPSKNPASLKANKQKASDVAQRHGVAKNHSYGAALVGFAGSVPAGRLKKLMKDECVETVERDVEIQLDPMEMSGVEGGRLRRSLNNNNNNKGAGNGNGNGNGKKKPDKPGNPGGGGDDGGGSGPAQEIPWGISRVGTADGTGKTAWIIDTGINLDHPDLNVDTSKAYSAFTKGKDRGFDDGNGHGTHVAGTVAAIDNNIGVVGVAAGATCVPIKVLSSRGSGSYSGIIAGVEHVAANADSGDVANMSLGGGAETLLDQAVYNAAAGGVYFVLAAGNSKADANGFSPARVNGPNIYTVSAFSEGDNWASFSNYGSSVDFAAPGVFIKSTWRDGGYNTISGTSMAAPHLAGILAVGNVASDGNVNGDPDDPDDPIAHLA